MAHSHGKISKNVWFWLRPSANNQGAVQQISRRRRIVWCWGLCLAGLLPRRPDCVGFSRGDFCLNFRVRFHFIIYVYFHFLLTFRLHFCFLFFAERTKNNFIQKLSEVNKHSDLLKNTTATNKAFFDILQIPKKHIQAQRRAAAGRSRHKSHGVIQY